MATTKEIWQRICNRQVKESDSKHSSLMGRSSKSEYVTAPAAQSERATTSSSPFLSACSHHESLMERTENGKVRSGVEEQIEHSKRHWSQLVDYSDSDKEEVEAETDNVEVFKSLQMHPTWGSFIRTICECEMVMGEKFAEGGQAELYEAQVYGHKNSQFNFDAEPCEWNNGYAPEFSLKVFKKGTSVRHLQSQWPEGVLEDHVERVKRAQQKSILSGSRHTCGPFSKETAELVMFCIAQGMNWLHSHCNIVYDLKASNVLHGEISPKVGI